MGIFMPCGAFLTVLLYAVCKTYSLSNLAQLCCGPNPNTHININKKTPHGCLFYLWRMVRDSNPRWSCPHNGFQDRRIRPLCQPSETVSVGLSTYGFGVSHDTVMFTLHFADARSQDTHASTRSANHPKLCPSVLQPTVLVALSQ